MEIKFKKYINKHFEEQMGLVEVCDDGVDNVIMYGDYYHDKISAKIEGFLIGVQFTDEWTYSIETEYITEEHEMYYKLDFCED